MSDSRYSKIGLFTSDPRSKRMERLEVSFSGLGVETITVLPWKVARHGSQKKHVISIHGIDLSELEMLFVLDLGANDIGTFFNRVGLISALAEMGVKIINPVQSILQMRNKAETMRKLISANLPVPETLITESIEDAVHFVKSHVPCVLKPITGFGGHGVQLIEDQFDLDNIYDYLKFYSQMFGKGAYILQEYIRNPGFDIRALVLKDEILATMQRVGVEGIVTNIHSGGIPRKNDVDVDELAIKAARSVKGQFVGVDIILDEENNPFVLEVNATPGWMGIQNVTDFDITQRIAEKISLK
ncbi:MAG: ATP-grasp domain-containing protein [Candidatus Thorarchaeota archaeon]